MNDLTQDEWLALRNDLHASAISDHPQLEGRLVRCTDIMPCPMTAEALTTRHKENVRRWVEYVEYSPNE